MKNKENKLIKESRQTINEVGPAVFAPGAAAIGTAARAAAKPLERTLRDLFRAKPDSPISTVPGRTPPAPQAPARLPAPARAADDISSVGAPTSTGGQVFRDQGRTINQAGPGREAAQQAARARVEAARAQRAADQEAARRATTAKPTVSPSATGTAKPTTAPTTSWEAFKKAGGMLGKGVGLTGNAAMTYYLLKELGLLDKAEEYLNSIRGTDARSTEIKRSGEEAAERVLRGEKVDLGGAKPEAVKDADKPETPVVDLSPKPPRTELSADKPKPEQGEPKPTVPVDIATPEPEPERETKPQTTRDIPRVLPPVGYDEPSPEPETETKPQPSRVPPRVLPPVDFDEPPPPPPPGRRVIPPIMPPPVPPPPPPPDDKKPEPTPEPPKPPPPEDKKPEPPTPEPPKPPPPEARKPEPEPAPAAAAPVKPQETKPADDDGPFWRSPGGADKDETGLGYLGSETSRLDVSPAGRIQTGFDKHGNPRHPELYSSGMESIEHSDPALIEWLQLAGLTDQEKNTIKENIMKPYTPDTNDISRLLNLLKVYESEDKLANGQFNQENDPAWRAEAQRQRDQQLGLTPAERAANERSQAVRQAQFKADISTVKQPSNQFDTTGQSSKEFNQAASRLAQTGVDLPGLMKNEPNSIELDAGPGFPDAGGEQRKIQALYGAGMNEDEMEEGNLFTKNLKDARDAGKKKADLDGDGDLEPVKEDQLAECGMMEPPTNEMPMDDHEQKKHFDITATMNSEGEKNITVHAEGEAAEELAQILKLSGMAQQNPMSVQEAYANEPKVKVMSTDTIMKQGNDLNRPKKSYSSKPGKHDNPMADKLAESWQEFKKANVK